MKEEFENEDKLTEGDIETEGNIENGENITEEQRKKKKKKKIVLAVILAILAALAILFIATPYKLLFSSKKMTFLTYLVEDATSVTELAKKIIENDIFEFLKNDETKLMDLQIDINDKSLTGTTVIAKDYFALKLNEINQNYYLLENEKIDELLEKLNMSDYEISSEVNVKDLLKFTNSEIKKIKNFALNSCYDILENVEDDDIRLVANTNVSINSGTRNVESIELKMSESKFLEIQKIVLERFVEDGIFDIYVEKIEDLVDVEKSELKTSYQDYIEYLNNYIDYMRSYHKVNNIEESNFIIYRMYLEDENVISREIVEKTSYGGSDYEDVIASLITTGDYYEFKTFTQIDQSAAYYNVLSDTITEENNVKNHKISYKLGGFTVSYPEEGQEFAYTPILAETIYNVSIEDLTDYTRVDISDENNINKFVLDYNKDNIKMDLASNNENKVNVKIDAKKDKTLTKDSLVTNGAKVLNTMTQEELMTELNSVITKLGEIL